LSKVIDYGIGIGLSNSREIARYIGGDVSLISSEPGCTIFQIIFPISSKNNSQVKVRSDVIQKS
jgi:signal transduction histidine kinase